MKKYFLLFSTITPLFFAFNVYADNSFMQDEINQIKEDIVVIQRQLYRDKNDTVAPQESVSNTQMRLGEYDELIRNINGKVENIEYRLNTLEKKIEGLNKDIDLRFEQQAKRQGAPAISPNKAKNQKAPAGTDPKKLYEQALNDLKADKLANAEEKFSQFINSYPNDALAGNAQYWLGETYYKQQNFAKAAIAFKDGYTNYSNGTKGPDCMLKLGLSLKALKKENEACSVFLSIPSAFEKANNDILKRADNEVKTLKCKK